jgi:SAM-dependent methyltransferase
MRHLFLFYSSLLGSVYIRIIIGFFRWFYYVKILKRTKILDNTSSIEGTLEHNLQPLKNFPLVDFTMKRMDRLLSIANTFEFLNNNSNFLIIGPRTESDIFKLKYYFPFCKIHSIDLISYSPLIELQDAHNTNFLDNYFDCIISGWVIKYSHNKKKMLNEMVRITKNGGIIILGFEFLSEKVDMSTKSIQSGIIKSNDLYEVNCISDIKSILDQNSINFESLFEYDAILKKLTSEEIYKITGMHGSQVMFAFKLLK